MTRPLRILHLEDDPEYSDLVVAQLDQEGLDTELDRVETREDFEAALERGNYDVILADYLLHDFDGVEALGIAREKCPNIPFLMVSGTIQEHVATESLRSGATDYVMKNWPERLVPAVRRAAHEAEEKAGRRLAETELHRRETYFRALTENSLDVLSILDAKGYFGYNSPSIEGVLGYTPLDLTGVCAFSLVHPEDLPKVLAAFEQGLLTPESTVRLDFRVKHQDRTWRHVEAIGQNRLEDPEISGFVLNTRDVSDRKRAEQALRESETRFRDLFEASPDAIFVEDCQGIVLDVNPAACALHGYSREQLIGANVADLVPAHLREAVVRDFAELVTGSLRQMEGSSLASDGREVPVEVRASPIEYAGKQAVVLHVRDISERKVAEAAVRSSEMLFHSVWENSVEGMRLTDDQGVIIAVNEAYCRLAGLAREQLEGQFFSSLYAESENPGVMLEEYRETFQQRAIERSVKQRCTLHDGRIVMLEGSNSFVELQGQPPMLLSLFRDVTRQDQLEEQLRQAQKMEAIGQLAGGIAHDFNNILTVIHGHASLLLATGGVAGGPARCAQQIVQAADRATALTRQLLTFGRRHLMQPRRMDLNEVVNNMTQMLGRLLGEDIALQLSYSPHPATVEADASMMEQVLLNLAVNARDAMPEGGVLNLGIASVIVDADHVSRFPEGREGQFICLSAADNGCGIEPENIRRIFEPFFTTKAVGKGTGLGLATVYGIVNQHHGWIEVESEPGLGTLFRVFLPLCDELVSQAVEPPFESDARGGKETILVVEDEETVRELVCGLLAGFGYEILQAESGVKALEVWDSCKDRVDLVLTDLVMPDRLNGRELAEKLWAQRPDLKVIFTSGYSAEVVGKEFVIDNEMTYLQKPYHPNVLASVVRECLDAVN